MNEDKLYKSVNNQSEKLLDKPSEDKKETNFNLATSVQIMEDHVHKKVSPEEEKE
jgi:hypothetical protein